MSPIDLEKALLDPSDAFDSPESVLTAPGLGRATRIAILERWRQDAEALSVADGEGMAGADPAPILRRVEDALRSLREAEAASTERDRTNPSEGDER